MSRPNAAWTALFLSLAVAAAFLPALWHDFLTYDDQSYVVQNPYVQAGLTFQSIHWAFGSFSQANWHPLTWLSHMLDCQFFGLAAWGHHLGNILLHSLNSALLFLFLVKTTGAFWRSAFVGGLFGFHPLHVESVAWVAERKDVLSGLFFLLTLWAYAKYAEVRGQKTADRSLKSEVRSQRSEVRGQKSEVRIPSWDGGCSWYVLTLVFFALGLMSKPMVVTLPFVLLLLDWWPLGRFKHQIKNANSSSRPAQSCDTHAHRLILEKVPFLLLAGGSCVVTLAAQNSGGTVTALAGLPLAARCANALVSYSRYLGKTFWPVNLSVFYPHPGQWPIFAVVCSAVLLITISALVWVLRRSHPWLVTGWWWFVGMLVPVIGLVQAGWQAMADRYTYLPSIGFFIALTWTVSEVANRRRISGVLLSVAGSVSLLACLAVTQQQLSYWKNTGTLFRHAIAVTGKSYVACANLGNYAAANGDIDEAVAQYEQVVQILPDAQAHSNLGAVLYRRGRIDAALEQFAGALNEDPNYVDAHIGLGTALAAKGRLDEAKLQLATALTLNPNSAPAHVALGYIFAGTGQPDRAIRHFRQALALQPNYPGVREQLQVLTGR